MNPVNKTKERVEKALRETLRYYSVDRDGSFFVHQGSAIIFIDILEWVDDRTLVRIYSPLVKNIRMTPALSHFLIETNSSLVFGRFQYNEKVGVILDHMLLGDTLDKEELETCLIALAITADEFDDAISQQFGGQRFTE